MSEPRTIPSEMSEENLGVFRSGMDRSVGADEVQFTHVTDYTTFLAEYAYREDQGMLVFHFFKSDEIRSREDADAYWTETFASVLSEVAPEVLSQTFPQLQAGYVEKIESWWMLSKRFTEPINMEQLTARLFTTLDAALENVLTAPDPARQ